MKKNVLFLCLLAAVLISGFVSAADDKLTVVLGESRKVLDVQTGEEVRRFVYIENRNTYPLAIELSPSGDLKDMLILEEDNFVLEPNETRRSYYTIKALEPGTTETRINVQYKKPNGEGAGLIVTLIVIAHGDVIQNDTPGDIPSIIVGTVTGSNNFSTIILVLSSVSLIIVLIALLIYASKKGRKGVRRPRA